MIFLACAIKLVINLTAIDTFKWSLTRLGVVISICIVVYSMLMFGVISRILTKYIKGLYLSSFVIEGTAMIILGLPAVVNFKTLTEQYIQMAVCILMNIFSGLSAVILARD